MVVLICTNVPHSRKGAREDGDRQGWSPLRRGQNLYQACMRSFAECRPAKLEAARATSSHATSPHARRRPDRLPTALASSLPTATKRPALNGLPLHVGFGKDESDLSIFMIGCRKITPFVLMQPLFRPYVTSSITSTNKSKLSGSPRCYFWGSWELCRRILGGLGCSVQPRASCWGLGGSWRVPRLESMGFGSLHFESLRVRAGLVSLLNNNGPRWKASSPT